MNSQSNAIIIQPIGDMGFLPDADGRSNLTTMVTTTTTTVTLLYLENPARRKMR